MTERFLIIETSGRVGRVALADGATILDEKRLDGKRRHARDLAPAIKEILRAAQCRAPDLDAIFVSRGPGSYTGLRVGIITAKMLAYATGTALLGVDTFLAIARQAPPDVPRLDVLADAQQGKIYVQRFSIAGGRGVLPEFPLRIQEYRAWRESRDSGVWTTGPGLERYAAELGSVESVLPADLWAPTAASIFRAGLERFRAGERDDPSHCTPLYLRPSSAEENWPGRASNAHAGSRKTEG